MDFHKDVNTELISKVVLLYATFRPLSAQKCNRGFCFLFAMRSTCCLCPICKILSKKNKKHSEQIQTWRVQSQTCSGQDMLVSHRAERQDVWFMLFTFRRLPKPQSNPGNDGAEASGLWMMAEQTGDNHGPFHML